MQNQNQNEEMKAAAKLEDVDPAIRKQIEINVTVKLCRNVMHMMDIPADRVVVLLQIPKKERKSYISILSNGKPAGKPSGKGKPRKMQNF